MAVAKGANIPKERLLDAVEATARAQSRFEQWAAVRSSDMPDNMERVDAMQVTLAAWQNDRFGHVPTSDVHMALGVIEELGEAFDEDAGPEDSVDALGDVMVYASQLCTANRLAVRPVIELAELYVKTNRCHMQPITIAGMLAHVALKHAQNIRDLGPTAAYQPRLVDALAMMIGKAIEDCVIGHELVVEPLGVFCVIGAEVTQRKQGDVMIPATDKEQRANAVSGIDPQLRVRLMGDDGKMHDVAPEDHRVEALAYAQRKLGEGVDMLAKPEAIEEGNFTAPTFLRVTSNEPTAECPIWDPIRGVWCESDEQLAARINKQHADLSA